MKNYFKGVSALWWLMLVLGLGLIVISMQWNDGVEWRAIAGIAGGYILGVSLCRLLLNPWLRPEYFEKERKVEEKRPRQQS